MTELVRYDAMCRAIDAAYGVDEVKDIRDKALAIAKRRTLKPRGALARSGYVLSAKLAS